MTNVDWHAEYHRLRMYVDEISISAAKARRERIATAVLGSTQHLTIGEASDEAIARYEAIHAVRLADALIAELDKDEAPNA
jgi:hypothetical protein